MPNANQGPMYQPPSNKPKISTAPPQTTNDTAVGVRSKPMPAVMPPTQGGPARHDNSAARAKFMNNRPSFNLMPGQGHGPMPIGTKPLPQPMVKPPQASGSWEDPNYDKMGGDGGWTYGNARDAGRWGNPGQVGDPRLEMNDPRYGNGQEPWLAGKMLPQDIGPGSANEMARAGLRGEWEARNGPWQGGPRMGGDNMPENNPTMGYWGPKGSGPISIDQVRSRPMPPQFGGMNPKMDGNSPYAEIGVGRAPVSEPVGEVSAYAPPQQGGAPGSPAMGGGGRQPLRPGMEYRPGGGQRPQGGGGVPPPPGMDPGIWAGMDEETKRRWMGMSGGGGMQPILPNEQGQAPMPQQQPRQWDPRMGSGYYGAF